VITERNYRHPLKTLTGGNWKPPEKYCQHCWRLFSPDISEGNFLLHPCTQLDVVKENIRIVDIVDHRFHCNHDSTIRKLTEEQQSFIIALDEMVFNDTVGEKRRNMVLTGVAGSGKSTTLRVAMVRAVLKYGYYSVFVAAPTQAAATIVNGETIHNLFCADHTYEFDQPEVTIERVLKNLRSEKNNIKYWRIRQDLKVLFIDEVGMVGCKFLNTIDQILKKIIGTTIPFGGITIILSGDALQVPPFTKKKENYQHCYVKTQVDKRKFFFESEAFCQGSFKVYYLKTSVRQEKCKKEEIDLLNRARISKLLKSDRIVLNSPEWGSECSIDDKTDLMLSSVESIETDLTLLSPPTEANLNKVNTTIMKMLYFWSIDRWERYVVQKVNIMENSKPRGGVFRNL
jgi:hypothetical protein